MARLRRRAAARLKRLREEDGLTLPELAVTAILLAIIAVAVMTFIVVSARQYGNQEDRVTTTDEARNALMRISSDLRDAGAVSVAGGVVTAEVRQADGSLVPTTYSCAPDGGGLATCSATTATGSEQLVSGVVNTDNFVAILGSDVDPTATQGGAVAIRLELQLDDAANPFVLATAVKPRNCSEAAGVVNPC